MINLEIYQEQIKEAIKLFWETRNNQQIAQSQKLTQDTGNRSAVTGGKQLDGLLRLLQQVAIDTGIPRECIYIKGNQLPGFFRPTKDWDLLIVSPNNKLIAVIELKSQVGSFGNNFNNRTEEALGSATDLWTAFRENAFPNQTAPWLGYLMIVEKSEKSTKAVRNLEPYFPIFNEFKGTSYLDRYKLFCEKLMLERLYSQCCLMPVTNNHTLENVSEKISIDTFLYSFIGHLTGQLHEFKK